jgi:hypothetical protein
VATAPGKDAKTRLAAMAAAGGSGAPGAVLAEAMAAAERRSLFYFLDLRQLTSTLGAVLPAADALGRGTEPLPVWGGVEGDANGRVLTLDLTVPPSCFSGLGAFLQGAALPTPGAPPGGSP